MQAVLKAQINKTDRNDARGILGRLMAIEDPAIKSLLDAGRRLIRPSAMLTRTPSLTPPGAETAHLEVDAPITSCAALTDGGLVASDRNGRLHWLEILN
jgi:hypothetical protein